MLRISILLVIQRLNNAEIYLHVYKYQKFLFKQILERYVGFKFKYIFLSFS